MPHTTTPGSHSGDLRIGLHELNQARISSSKAAHAQVEVFEMRFEVDVQPFASSCTGAVSGSSDQAGADALSLVIRMDHRIEEKSMGTAVPANLDEPDELAGVERADPRERVFLQALRPRPHLGGASTECPGMQHAELPIVYGEA